MAQFDTGTTGSITGKLSHSQREDLANFISNIVRDDVPFTSSIGKGKSKAVFHEWSTDTLDRPGKNKAAEGAAYGSNPTGLPEITRLGNYTQIFTKKVHVTGTIEVVDKAGRKSEFKYQSEKRGKELMRDIEWSLVAGTTDNVSASGQTRSMGGYQSWAPIVNTVDTGTAGTPGVTVAKGDGTNLATFGGTTPGVFSLSDVDEVMQNVWQNGGKPTTLMMSPKKKRAFSIAAQGQIGTDGAFVDNNVRRNLDEKGKLRQSVTMYESDFGLVSVVPNYIMAKAGVGSGSQDGTDTTKRTDTDILVYDPASFKMATLRPLHHRDISEDGDQLRALMVHETTLQCMNPEGVGLIGNLAE